MRATILSTVVVPAALMLVMLGLGLALAPRDFSRVFNRPRTVALGLFCQLFLLPALGCGVALLFGLEPALALGLIVLALCPGGVLSNALCNLVRADLALSVSLTAMTSLVTPITLPVFYRLAAARWVTEPAELALPVAGTAGRLLLISVLPIVVGMAIRGRLPTWARRAERPVQVLSVVLFLVVISGIVAQNLDVLGEGIRKVGLAALTLNLSAQLLGLSAARTLRLRGAEATTIAIEVGIQNAATATFVCVTLLDSTRMAISAAVYAALMLPSAFLLGLARRKRVAEGARPTVLA